MCRRLEFSVIEDPNTPTHNPPVTLRSTFKIYLHMWTCEVIIDLLRTRLHCKRCRIKRTDSVFNVFYCIYYISSHHAVNFHLWEMMQFVTVYCFYTTNPTYSIILLDDYSYLWTYSYSHFISSSFPAVAGELLRIINLTGINKYWLYSCTSREKVIKV